MSTLEKLRELAAARSVRHDVLEEGAHFGRVMACEIEVHNICSELVDEVAWRASIWRDLNITVISHSDRRVRLRHVRRTLERHFAAIDPTMDLRSGTIARALCEEHARNTIELEDQLFRSIMFGERVPYTDNGITAVQNAIRDTLEARGYANVTVNAVQNGDQAEVAYTGTAPAAVHEVTITGRVDF